LTVTMYMRSVQVGRGVVGQSKLGREACAHTEVTSGSGAGYGKAM
jgi:hypothetical protein